MGKALPSVDSTLRRSVRADAKRRRTVRRADFLQYFPAERRQELWRHLEPFLKANGQRAQFRALAALEQVLNSINSHGSVSSLLTNDGERLLSEWSVSFFGATRSHVTERKVDSWRRVRKVLLHLMAKGMVPTYDLPLTNPHGSIRGTTEYKIECVCTDPRGNIEHQFSELRFVPKPLRAKFLETTRNTLDQLPYGHQRKILRDMGELLSETQTEQNSSVFGEDPETAVSTWLTRNLLNKEGSERKIRLDEWRSCRRLLQALTNDGVIVRFSVPASDPGRHERVMARAKAALKKQQLAKQPKAKVVKFVPYPVSIKDSRTGTLRTYNAKVLKFIPRSQRRRFSKDLSLALTGRSESDQRRSLRVLNQFAEWLHDQQPTPLLITSIPSSQHVRDWLRTFLTKKTKASFITKHGEWALFRRFLRRLMTLRAIKPVRLPQPSSKVTRLAAITKTKKSVLDKLVLSKEERRVLSAPERATDDFFKTVQAKCDALYRAVRAQALVELREAASLFAKGRALAAECDIDRLRSLMHIGLSVDPTLMVGRAQAHPSLFSKMHPNGLANLIGWCVHENHSMLYDDLFPGAWNANSILQDQGGINKVRAHFSLTLDVVGAAFAFLALDKGLNVESLERAEIKDGATGSVLLVPTDSETEWILTLSKPRARREIGGYVKADQHMGTVETIQLILALTESWRTTFGLNHLWLHHGDRRNAAITPISSTGFKTAHDAFLSRIPRLSEMVLGRLTRADIRVLSGICKWFETGGDMVKTAKHLHNSPGVAIKNYIPSQLREAFYAFQVRRFQTLTLMAATYNDRTLAKRALRFESMDKVNKAFSSMLSNKALADSPLMKAAAGASRTVAPHPDGKSAFLVNARNVAVMQRLSDTIDTARRSRPDTDFLAIQSRGISLQHWRDLWVVVGQKMSSGAHRALEPAWKEGMALAKDSGFKVDFPFLTPA